MSSYSSLRRMVFVALVALATTLPGVAAADTIQGELVVLDGSADRFRLVGRQGTFTAPAGASLAALDGKSVDVELDGGRVVRISERLVVVTPVTSTIEMVQGQLVVRDPIAGSFAFAGDSRVYVAPAGVAIAPYGGQWVEATLDGRGQVTDLALVPPPPPPASRPLAPLPPPVAQGATPCLVDTATTVASGSSVCRDGSVLRCDNGAWVRLGTACR